VVNYRPHGNGNFIPNVPTTSLNAVVSGLNSNTSYDFEVQSANIGGLGIASNIVTVSTLNIETDIISI